jgi:hypothetical protein
MTLGIRRMCVRSERATAQRNTKIQTRRRHCSLQTLLLARRAASREAPNGQNACTVRTSINNQHTSSSRCDLRIAHS